MKIIEFANGKEPDEVAHSLHYSNILILHCKDTSGTDDIKIAKKDITFCYARCQLSLVDWGHFFQKLIETFQMLK